MVEEGGKSRLPGKLEAVAVLREEGSRKEVPGVVIEEGSVCDGREGWAVFRWAAGHAMCEPAVKVDGVKRVERLTHCLCRGRHRGERGGVVAGHHDREVRDERMKTGGVLCVQHCGD